MFSFLKFECLLIVQTVHEVQGVLEMVFAESLVAGAVHTVTTEVVRVSKPLVGIDPSHVHKFAEIARRIEPADVAIEM